MRGVGGTRTTEWWFTDQAVLIDTAGRYTTQDSHADADARSWRGLLDLLKKHRPRQPLTGVLVAVSVPELIGRDEQAAAEHGRAVRQRINELTSAFGVRLPVYVLLTKIDLLAGFTEFFDTADAKAREQVWGHTFAHGADPAPAPADGFNAAFDGLLTRLNDRLLSRVQDEADMQRRGVVFAFPQQVASLREPLARLLQLIGRETRFETTPLLRGFYFTSGVQDGRPIDRLLTAIASRFDLAAPARGRDAAVGRSYFLRDLLGEVIFPEAALAGRDPAAERRRLRLRTGALVGGGVLVALLTLGWLSGYLRNAHLVDRLTREGTELRQELSALPKGAVGDADLDAVLPALERARALPYASTAPKDLRSAGFGFGVGAAAHFRPQVDATYRNLLNRQFLPRLLLGLEDQLRAGVSAPQPAAGAPDDRPVVYNLLRTYLMLGRGPGAPLEKAQVEAAFGDRWADRYPGEEDAPKRDALGRHLTSLLAGPLSPPPLDRDLIAAARGRIATLGPGERVYTRLAAEPSLRDLAPYVLSEVPSVADSGLFVRRSGKPLTAGVPGMFRRAAFYAQVLPAIAKIAAQSADEGWVTGQAGAAAGAAPLASEAGRVKDAVLVAYLRDFTGQWDGFIADIAVSGQRTPADRIQVAVRPPSPVKQLVSSLASETDLTPPNINRGSGAAALRTGALFSRSLYRGLSQANRVESTVQSTPSGPPGALDEVIAHFSWLRDLNPASGPAPIDEALQALAQVGDSMAASRSVAGLGDPLLQRTRAASAMEATAKLDQVTASLPGGAAALFNGFVKSSAAQLNSDVKQGMEQAYESQLRPECKTILASGFPFTPTATHQATVDDFSRLLRYGGLFDAFATQQLGGYLATGGGATASASALKLQPEALKDFQRAQSIRDQFFKPGEVRPGVRFLLEPTQISGAATVTVTVDGAAATFDAAGRKPVELRWPGGGSPGVTVSFQPPGGGPPVVKTWTGDWALFTWLRQSHVLRSNASGVTFQVGDEGVAATFSLRLLDASRDPFVLTDVAALSCPDHL